MILQIQTTQQLEGKVTPPSSKSQCVRALFVAILANGSSIIHNFLEADDTAAALSVCRGLGADIQLLKAKCHPKCLVVQSKGAPFKPVADHFFCGDSGITTRFLLPILGLQADPTKPLTVDAGAQMKARPIQSLIKALQNLGLQISSLEQAEKLPLQISGRLQGGKTEVDGVTSQYLSALLLASPYAQQKTTIEVENLHERPYVEMTLQWLKDDARKFAHHRDGKKDIFEIEPGQKYQAFEKVIPGDFSSASYFLAAGSLIPGEIIVEGMDVNDPQGDKRLMEILKTMGADIKVEGEMIKVKGPAKLKGMAIDANDIPDMVPTLAVIATQAEGKTEIFNVPQARLKETDRLRSMAEGLKKMGARIEEKPDGLVIYKSRLYAAQVRGYSDHRTIMALAIAGMLATGESEIDTAEGINKTFPNYGDLMRNLGAKMSQSDKDLHYL